MRKQFDQQLHELRDEILAMGRTVEEELQLALKALQNVDVDMAQTVRGIDSTVNSQRRALEEKCFELIVTQQPTARDLRAIIAVINMIIDLERMGDQAKGIAKLIPHLASHGKWDDMAELQRMGNLVVMMLNQSMLAYAQDNIELARFVVAQDKEADKLFDNIFTQIMEIMTRTQKQKKVEAAYDILRAARELERFGDLAVNVAERVIYIVTGTVSL